MRKFLPALLFASLIAFVLILFNRRQSDSSASAQATEVKVEAQDLLSEYMKDEAGANEKYLNKIVEVKGTVAATHRDDGRGAYVVLRAGSTTKAVRCKLDSRATHRRKEFHEGEKVTLKGICTGLVGDVELVQCVEVR